MKAKECEAQSNETAPELALRFKAIKKDDNGTFYSTIVKTVYEIRFKITCKKKIKCGG